VLGLWPLGASLRWLRAKGGNPRAGIGWLIGHWALSCVAAGIVVIGMTFLEFGRGAGHFDRPKMEAIVVQMRTMGLRPGEEKFFMVTSFDQPQTLRRANGYSPPGHRVWGAVSKDGKICVAIETKDHGHFGHYGFAYFEDPLKPESFQNENWPGPMVEVLQPIDAHWCEVMGD
jgi:hypothetical protein